MTLRWPLVGRLAYDEAARERDWLRQKVDTLTDQLIRLERVREGLREVAPEPKRPVEPIPPEVRRLIGLWDSAHGRESARRRALQLYTETQDWTTVRRTMAHEQGVEIDDHNG